MHDDERMIELSLGEYARLLARLEYAERDCAKFAMMISELTGER